MWRDGTTCKAEYGFQLLTFDGLYRLVGLEAARLRFYGQVFGKHCDRLPKGLTIGYKLLGCKV